MTLQTERVRSMDQVRQIALGIEPVEFRLSDRASAYAFIQRTLVQFDYGNLGRSDKGTVKRYLERLSGLSRAQVTRLIGRYREVGHLQDRRSRGPARPFERRYTSRDIRLLAETDALLGQSCGPATRAVMKRQYEQFGDRRFARLAGLSNGHLYNLRKSRTYRFRRSVFTRTRPTAVQIGQRARPGPDGQPGFLRVDTVHQGDRDGVKGVYLINTVDEVTQYQYVGAVSAISEHFLMPVLESLIRSYPFVIQGFHSDNGSEYINHRVVRLLNKLRVEQFTKSRPRHSNDNALVEGKNGSVIRKYLGHDHIPQGFAGAVNTFTREVLSPYLNYHRPCLFARTRRDAKGKIRRYYRDQDIDTPYGRFRSLPGAQACLKPGISFAELDAAAHAQSDLQAAESMNAARQELFRLIDQGLRVA